MIPNKNIQPMLYLLKSLKNKYIVFKEFVCLYYNLVYGFNISYYYYCYDFYLRSTLKNMYQ